MSHEITPLDVRPLKAFLETHVTLCYYFDLPSYELLIAMTPQEPNPQTFKTLVNIFRALSVGALYSPDRKHILISVPVWDRLAIALNRLAAPGAPVFFQRPILPPPVAIDPSEQTWTIVSSVDERELDHGVDTSQIESAQDRPPPRSSSCTIL